MLQGMEPVDMIGEGAKQGMVKGEKNLDPANQKQTSKFTIKEWVWNFAVCLPPPQPPNKKKENALGMLTIVHMIYVFIVVNKAVLA